MFNHIGKPLLSGKSFNIEVKRLILSKRIMKRWTLILIILLTAGVTYLLIDKFSGSDLSEKLEQYQQQSQQRLDSLSHKFEQDKQVYFDSLQLSSKKIEKLDSAINTQQKEIKRLNYENYKLRQNKEDISNILDSLRSAVTLPEL